MEFTTEDEPDLTLPEGSKHRARLQEIKLRTFEWTDNATGERKEGRSLEWWWEITQTKMGPEYMNRRLKGQCNPKITNRSGNEFRKWAEALLQRPIPTGMTIDTDDLVGLEAEIQIGWRFDKKDTAKERPFDYVADVNQSSTAQSMAPPF